MPERILSTVVRLSRQCLLLLHVIGGRWKLQHWAGDVRCANKIKCRGFEDTFALWDLSAGKRVCSYCEACMFADTLDVLFNGVCTQAAEWGWLRLGLPDSPVRHWLPPEWSHCPDRQTLGLIDASDNGTNTKTNRRTCESREALQAEKRNYRKRKWTGRQEERKSAGDTQERENATIETLIHKLLLDFIIKLVQISMEQQNIFDIWSPGECWRCGHVGAIHFIFPGHYDWSSTQRFVMWSSVGHMSTQWHT